jgi:hypothetical protein
MKKLIYFALAFMLFAFVSGDTLSKKERKFAVNLLRDTQKEIGESVQGLSDMQLAFKPAADKWSVEDCLKHIAIAEQMIRGMVDEAVKQPLNPEKRVNIKATDEEIIKNTEDRSKKGQTMDPMKPENTPFKSAADALESFNGNREKLIGYINNTQDDLRSRVIEFPFGSYDAYQVLLLIGAHSNRHMQQINEVKASPDFPKN